MPAALEVEKSAMRSALKGSTSPGKTAFARRFSAAADMCGDDGRLLSVEVGFVCVGAGAFAGGAGRVGCSCSG
jgi:hypothetical protein